MRAVRIALGSAAVALAIVACESVPVHEAAREDLDAEPPRVPDPPPRYAKVHVTDAAAVQDGASELLIKCGGPKPYVCTLDDGTFVCSSTPCIPDCTRIGCLGGETCTACEGGFRCVAPGDGC